jgi:hypothetical protein
LAYANIVTLSAQRNEDLKRRIRKRFFKFLTQRKSLLMHFLQFFVQMVHLWKVEKIKYYANGDFESAKKKYSKTISLDGIYSTNEERLPF